MSKENKNAQSTESGAADATKKQSLKEQMSARRGPGDSTKADSGGGDSDKRVINHDVDTGPINTDRGS